MGDPRELLVRAYIDWLALEDRPNLCNAPHDTIARAMADVALDALSEPLDTTTPGTLLDAAQSQAKVRLMLEQTATMPPLQLTCRVMSVSAASGFGDGPVLTEVRVVEIEYTDETTERIARHRGVAKDELRTRLPVEVVLTPHEIERITQVEILPESQRPRPSLGTPSGPGCW